MAGNRPVTAGRNPNDKYPVKLRTVPDLCNNVSFAVVLSSNGKSYTAST